jgi:hypothetical protein
MARWKVDVDPKVELALKTEKSEIRALCPGEPEKLATQARVIQFRALNRLLLEHFTRHPADFSYPDNACDDEVLFADVYEWRFIITLESECDPPIVHVRYLSRNKDHRMSPCQTLDEWKRKYPPAGPN